MGFVHVRVPLETKAELAVYYGGEPTDRSQRLNFLPDAYLECFADDGEKCGVYPMAPKAELPAGRVAKVLFNAVDLEKVDELNLAYGGVDLETGERMTLAGKRSEKKEIKEFVGVSVVYDKIRKEHLVRTQIAGAGTEA